MSKHGLLVTLKHGFVNIRRFSTAIPDVHFSFVKHGFVSFPSVEIRVLASEGTFILVISVISGSAQLRVPAICYVSIETCRNVPKSAKSGVFGVEQWCHGGQNGVTSPLFRGEVWTRFDNTDTKHTKTPN